MFNRDTFFTYVRRSPFGNRLSQSQMDGLSDILDLWERENSDKDIRWLAYIMATAFHETGAKMQPVREGFATNDASAKRILAKYPYAKPNDKGLAYYGRGLVQLTWEANYKKMGDILNLPLVEDPDMALLPEVSTRILFEGMMKGASGKGDFTNKSLEDYFNATKDDPVTARRIINGTDKAELIAGYHKAFLDALTHAAEPVKPQDVVKPAVADGAKLSTDPAVLGATLAGGGGAVATLMAAIQNPYALAAFAIIALGVFLVVSGRIKLKRDSGV